jgi:hypothetical protein
MVQGEKSLRVSRPKDLNNAKKNSSKERKMIVLILPG